MMKHILRFVRNLAVLALCVLPLFFALVWIQSLIRRTPNSRDLGYSLETGGFYYLAYLGPVLVGGIGYHLLLYFVVRLSTARLQRLAAVLLTPVIFVTLLLFGQPFDPLREFLLPIGISLFASGFLVRLPPTREPTSGSKQEATTAA